MALGSNPSFSQIRAFFGGSNNFKDYYRGGPYVPNIPANNAIPTGPAGMSMRQFSGADKNTAPPVPNFGDASAYADLFVNSAGGGSCNAYVELHNNGQVYSYSSTNGAGYVSTWLPSGRSPGEYMARRSFDNGASWEGWQSLASTYLCVSANAWSDGFYSEQDSQVALVQIGYGGNVQAQANFYATASANGRG